MKRDLELTIENGDRRGARGTPWGKVPYSTATLTGAIEDTEVQPQP